MVCVFSYSFGPKSLKSMRVSLCFLRKVGCIDTRIELTQVEILEIQTLFKVKGYNR